MKLTNTLATLLTLAVLGGCSSSSDSNSSTGAAKVAGESSLSGTWSQSFPLDLTSQNDEVNIVHNKSVLTESGQTAEIASCFLDPSKTSYDIENSTLNARPITFGNTTITPSSYEIISDTELKETDSGDASRILNKMSNYSAIRDSFIDLEIEGIQSITDQAPTCITAGIQTRGNGSGIDVYRSLDIRFDADDSIYVLNIIYPKSMTVGTYEVNSSKLTPEGEFADVELRSNNTEITEAFGTENLFPIQFSGASSSRQEIEFYQLDEKKCLEPLIYYLLTNNLMKYEFRVSSS
ncbi:hypothetical protein ACFOEK_10325 [Litoribrevibacter euphylliae]|uniref:Lipoprotein n=1 Tax=Litoribrevibacter euphylliae TaxID=1834034 RepID=A0ABV7HIN8_9GAMM